MPLNNLPSVYIPTVVKLLLSDPSWERVSLKAEQRGQPSRGTCDTVCGAKGWTREVIGGLDSRDLGVSAGPGQWSPSVVRFLPWNTPLLHSRSGLGACPVSVEWVAACACSGFAGFWGNSGWGARWLRSCRLPWTRWRCGALSCWCLGPCWTGAQSQQEPIHTDPIARHAQRPVETIVSPRGS